MKEEISMVANIAIIVDRQLPLQWQSKHMFMLHTFLGMIKVITSISYETNSGLNLELYHRM